MIAYATQDFVIRLCWQLKRSEQHNAGCQSFPQLREKARVLSGSVDCDRRNIDRGYDWHLRSALENIDVANHSFTPR